MTVCIYVCVCFDLSVDFCKNQRKNKPETNKIDYLQKMR